MFLNHKFEASIIYSYLNTTTSELPSVIIQIEPVVRVFRSVIIDPFPWVCFRIVGALVVVVLLTAGFEVKRFEGNPISRMWCIFIVYVYMYM